MVKRNLLCIKKESELADLEGLLYPSYKGKLEKFVLMSKKKEIPDIKSVSPDPVTEGYDGLTVAPEDIKPKYEALLGVTGYYQHAKPAGLEAFTRESLRAITESCKSVLRLSNLPKWLEELSEQKEEEHMRWIGDQDITINLVNKVDSKLILLEEKMSVHTGCTSGRREILGGSKFLGVLDYLATNSKLYEASRKYSLRESLQKHGISSLGMYTGILLDREGNPATRKKDKKNMCYSGSEDGYKKALKIAKKSFTIKERDDDKLFLKFGIEDLEVEVGMVYGNDISEVLHGERFSISDVVIPKYDDIWLSQLRAISERTFLLRYGESYTTILKNLLKKDCMLATKYRKLIDKEGESSALIEVVRYLLQKYSDEFERLPKPKIGVEDYLADIVQILAASEA